MFLYIYEFISSHLFTGSNPSLLPLYCMIGPVCNNLTEHKYLKSLLCNENTLKYIFSHSVHTITVIDRIPPSAVPRKIIYVLPHPPTPRAANIGSPKRSRHLKKGKKQTDDFKMKPVIERVVVIVFYFLSNCKCCQIANLKFVNDNIICFLCNTSFKVKKCRITVHKRIIKLHMRTL
jgi:hypothetical protein